MASTIGSAASAMTIADAYKQAQRAQGIYPNVSSGTTIAPHIAPWSPIPEQFCDHHTRTITPKGLLLLRLGYFDARRGDMFAVPPVEVVEVRKLHDKYAVFVVARGEPLVLEDDVGLFPSDTLITKINLLKD